MSSSPFADRDIEAEARRAWFRQCVLPHEAGLRAYVHRLGLGLVDVDMVVEEALLRLLCAKAWTRLDARAALRAAGQEIVLQALGRAKVALIRPAANAPPLDGEPNSEDVPQRMTAIVEGLPRRRRRIFKLRKAEGLGVGAIADRLGLAASAVESQLVRGLRTCSERLACDPDPQSRPGTGSEPTEGGRQDRGGPLGRPPR